MYPSRSSRIIYPIRSTQQVAVAELKWGRKIASQPALKPYIVHEIVPGEAVQSDAELLELRPQCGRTTIYHPVGTCAMGHGSRSVVDPQLRVHDLLQDPWSREGCGIVAIRTGRLRTRFAESRGSVPRTA